MTIPESDVSLREYVEVQLSAIRSLMDERDRMYETRFRAAESTVATAIASQEKAVNAAFSASEKAIIKAEDAQREYNARSNEFRGQLDDQAKGFMTRTESDARIKTQEDKLNLLRQAMEAADDRLATDIRSLRESRSALTGGSQRSREYISYGIAAVSVVAALLTLIGRITGAF